MTKKDKQTPNKDIEIKVADVKKLTAKEEHFAQCIAVHGMTQADAYRTAYDVKAGTKASSVYCNASQLASDTKITQRIEQLRRQLTSENIMTKVEMLEHATTDARTAINNKGEPDYYNRRESRKEIAKLCGYNEPEQQNVNISGDFQANFISNLADKHGKKK